MKRKDFDRLAIRRFFKRALRDHIRVLREAWAYNRRMRHAGGGICSYLKAWYGTRLRQRLPLLPREVAIRVGVAGQTLRLPVRLTTISDAIALRGVFAEQAYAVAPVGAPVKRIVDLGANCGYATAYFCRSHPEAMLACVEPEPGNLVQLLKTIRWNSLPATVFSAAASDAIGLSHLATDEGFPARSRIKRDGDGLCVATITLGDVLSKMEWEDADVLKMDIEGSEDEVVRSSMEQLRLFRIVIFELHPHVDTEAVLRQMRNGGFDVQRVDASSEPVYLARRRE